MALSRIRCAAGVAALCTLFPVGPGTSSRAQAPAPSTQPEADAELARLFDQLGAEDFRAREEATEKLIHMGAPVVAAAERRLEDESDAEIRVRLRFILENIAPPAQAILVIRVDPTSGLEPGDVITHINGRRVRTAASLRRLFETDPRAMLRVRGRTGPREVGPLAPDDVVTIADYQSPRGEAIANVLRLYHTGFAERACELLEILPEAAPESELPAALRAIVAFTAGNGSAAVQMLGPTPEIVQPSGGENEWTTPSPLDLAGPGKAPFHLEWALWTRMEARARSPISDPDLRVQRVLVPAGRLVDALVLSARYWWSEFKQQLQNDMTVNQAGNLLAVCAWMFSDADLLSECMHLVEPRSRILARTQSGVRRWVRVQTDAWLPFLAGDPAGAVNAFYDDAREILSPPGPPRGHMVIRNPRIAAQIAFFLYQTPDDPRVGELLEVVNHAGNPTLATYVYWMLFGLTERNEERVRRDLSAVLPNLSGPEAAAAARALALLEYACPTIDRQVLESARERITEAEDKQDREYWAAILDALQYLADGRGRDARQALAGLEDGLGLAVLRHTADFAADPPAGAANIPVLHAPLLAVPLGLNSEQWIVLTRDRRLTRFDAAAGMLSPLDKPSPTWLPGPLQWPWLSRDEKTGRVWVYDRRRLLELGVEPPSAAFRMNLRPNDIPLFERFVAAFVTQLTDAVAGTPRAGGECGEFLTDEVRAGAEFVSDPSLPELGFIRPLLSDERIVHAALRGGPHLLIDTVGGRCWSSQWFADKLGLDRPLRFQAEALPGAAPPLVFLMSDRGLVRFDPSTETVKRLPLPGAVPFPEVVPESTPYARRDPRWVYFARLPWEGGQVYRLVLSEDRVEPVDMINEALPEGYYTSQSRAAIRARIDELLEEIGIAGRAEFIRDAIQTVESWSKKSE
jgi:hypothetical protein